MVKGNIAEEIKTLKQIKNKDIVVYGSNSFVSSSIKHELINEFYLLVNPVLPG